METNVPLDIDSHMPEPLRMEGLSRAYIDAIAARAGVSTCVPRNDFGVDVFVSKITRQRDGRRTDVPNSPVPLQLKASTLWTVREAMIVYDLEAKTYNDLVSNDDHILIFMCLPPDPEEWLDQDEDGLQLHKCCYYWRPSDGTETTNTATKRIFIPRRQLFTVDVLKRLVNRVEL